jgi:hypothetical protein
MSSPTPTHAKAATAAHDAASIPGKPSNFLRQIIESDLEKGTYAARHWAGSPGEATHQAAGQPDPAKIRTRFPPEPNGYLATPKASASTLAWRATTAACATCALTTLTPRKKPRSL